MPCDHRSVSYWMKSIVVLNTHQHTSPAHHMQQDEKKRAQLWLHYWTEGDPWGSAKAGLQHNASAWSCQPQVGWSSQWRLLKIIILSAYTNKLSMNHHQTPKQSQKHDLEAGYARNKWLEQATYCSFSFLPLIFTNSPRRKDEKSYYNQWRDNKPALVRWEIVGAFTPQIP